MKLLKRATLLVMLLSCVGGCAFAQTVADKSKPQNLTELRSAIQKILRETKTPGAGVVLVSGDKTIMAEGFGKADVERNINASKNTVFRLGSISKPFVALAILKLQEEGRLNLKDKIRDIIPEIKFTNPWEDKYPVRIEHLLEHSSGWKYWSMAELGYDDPKQMTLREALDFSPRSRTSLFIPGSRSSESNVGIAVAAYIVEKVSGLSFDRYMDVNFFRPMGLKSMSFLQSAEYKKHGATLYENGIRLSYLNMLYRPAAAISASPVDMATILKFFTSRGKFNGAQILSDSSICRMERGESFLKCVPKEYVKEQGLSNEGGVFNGVSYRGFWGSLPGGNAEFGYVKESMLGYAAIINGGDTEALQKLVDLIKGYQTKDFKAKPVEVSTKKHKLDIDPSGYYTTIMPKFDLTKALDLNKSLYKVWVANDTVCIKNIKDDGSLMRFVYTGNNQFRSVETDQMPLTIVNDPQYGSMIWPSLKKISPAWAYTLIWMFYLPLIVLFTSLVFCLIAVLVFLFGKKRSKVALLVSSLPFITYSFLLIAAGSLLLSIHNRYDAFRTFGTVNPISVLVFICGILFAASAIWSVYYIFKKRHEKMPKVFYYHSALAAILNVIFMVYFIYMNLIGTPTWWM